ncbi:MAG: biopolymer transporter ExbD [Pseudomonadota bacterium]
MKIEKRTVSDEIPTSSMADIAFLLIIYFMVTTTFAATRGLDFALPKDEDNPPIVEKEDSVLIEIQANGQLIVDQKPMQVDGILEYLKPKLENNPKKPVIIKPDPQAPYGHMVEVFDTLRQGKDELNLAQEINVSIPTRREIDAFWY